MGPLAAAWHGLQSVVRQEDGEEPDPENILKNLTDSVVLLGQAINKMAYERRLSVLAELSDVKNTKRQLRDNQEDINKEQKFLFGEEFQKHIKTLAKAQESAEKLFAKNSSGKKRSSSYQAGHPPTTAGPREVQPVEGQYLSTIFVRPKREMSKFRPIINLKQLNAHMPY